MDTRPFLPSAIDNNTSSHTPSNYFAESQNVCKKERIQLSDISSQEPPKNSQPFMLLNVKPTICKEWLDANAAKSVQGTKFTASISNSHGITSDLGEYTIDTLPRKSPAKMSLTNSSVSPASPGRVSCNSNTLFEEVKWLTELLADVFGERNPNRGKLLERHRIGRLLATENFISKQVEDIVHYSTNNSNPLVKGSKNIQAFKRLKSLQISPPSEACHNVYHQNTALQETSCSRNNQLSLNPCVSEYSDLRWNQRESCARHRTHWKTKFQCDLQKARDEQKWKLLSSRRVSVDNADQGCVREQACSDNPHHVTDVKTDEGCIYDVYPGTKVQTKGKNTSLYNRVGHSYLKRKAPSINSLYGSFLTPAKRRKLDRLSREYGSILMQYCLLQL